jgi:hypothetical protein
MSCWLLSSPTAGGTGPLTLAPRDALAFCENCAREVRGSARGCENFCEECEESARIPFFFANYDWRFSHNQTCGDDASHCKPITTTTTTMVPPPQTLQQMRVQEAAAAAASAAASAAAADDDDAILANEVRTRVQGKCEGSARRCEGGASECEESAMGPESRGNIPIARPGSSWEGS